VEIVLNYETVCLPNQELIYTRKFYRMGFEFIRYKLAMFHSKNDECFPALFNVLKPQTFSRLQQQSLTFKSSLRKNEV